MDRPELNARLRKLPSVDEVLRSDAIVALHRRLPRWALVRAVRDEVDRLREATRTGPSALPESSAPVVDPAEVERRAVALCRPTLEPVVNATGVVLHTNLGRAPLAESALRAVVDVAKGYSNLEYDLERGARGSRHHHVAELLRELCGAEAALVVNNNAAAVLLALSQVAAGREVIVSRGELVEIGGAFRVPDVMAASGARLVEVGTTNRTHAADYERAITPATAALLKVHRSNFAVVGFTAEVEVDELSAIAHRSNVPLLCDLGSGCFVDLGGSGIGREPTVRETVRAGVDLVTFSGDKLLGGPQAGILVGTEARIAPLRKHPLLRALRPDKMTLAALAATLALYRDDRASEVPAVGMLLTEPALLATRARRLLEAIAASAPEVKARVVETKSAVGGGALPLAEPVSWAVALDIPNASAERIDQALRHQTPPVVGRIADDRLLLDVRTLRETDLPTVAQAVRAAHVDLSLSLSLRVSPAMESPPSSSRPGVS
jgi:L-seryl-tRNA(Ser) seleniumtransferase